MDGLSKLKTQLRNARFSEDDLSFDNYKATADAMLPAEKANGLYSRLVMFAQQRGYTVDDRSEMPARGGYPNPETSGQTDFELRSIWIRPTLSPQNKLMVLIHEVAHTFEPTFEWVLTYGPSVKTLSELLAEGTVWAVSEKMGWPTTRPLLYIANGLGDRPVERFDAAFFEVEPRLEQSTKAILDVLGAPAARAAA